jgi:diacylglycerol O-acyltransferase / wax synthase
MSDQLSALDGTFLELEQMDEGATMHIGGVMIFDPLPGGGVPTLEAVGSEVGSRLAALERYSQQLSSQHVGGLAWPRWQADPHFDLSTHIRRAVLPAPGGDTELCEWAADFFSHRLDRTRPLWEMTLLEGLEQGRWALATKTHHCLTDGVGSVDVVDVMLDGAGAPRASAVRPPEVHPSTGWKARVPHAPDAVADVARTGARAAGGGVHAVLHPRETLERSRSMAELIVRDEVISAPRTSLNVPIGAARRYEIVRASLHELKAIGHEFEGSVNDVALAACAAGLRQMLLSRDEHPPAQGLRAMVPVNLRSASQKLALGNRISSLFVELPVAEADAAARLRRIIEHTQMLKSSGAAVGAATVVDLAGLAPPLLHALIARSLYATRLFNVTITNVPGPRGPRQAFGAALREIHPIVPLAAEHAVGIAIISCNDTVVLGLSADRDSTPDFDVLVAGVKEGLAELRALLAPAGRTSLAKPGGTADGAHAARRFQAQGPSRLA